MSDLEKWLAEGEALEKAATKGPWEADEYGVKGPADIGKPAVLAKNSAFIADARTRVVRQAAIIRVMREALQVATPRTVHVVAGRALAEAERIARGQK
mgnify:CR=1 FL=1